jgi:hypothetical protein
VVLGFEHRVSPLVGRCSTTCTLCQYLATFLASLISSSLLSHLLLIPSSTFFSQILYLFPLGFLFESYNLISFFIIFILSFLLEHMEYSDFIVVNSFFVWFCFFVLSITIPYGKFLVCFYSWSFFSYKQYFPASLSVWQFFLIRCYTWSETSNIYNEFKFKVWWISKRLCGNHSLLCTEIDKGQNNVYSCFNDCTES